MAFLQTLAVAGALVVLFAVARPRRAARGRVMTDAAAIEVKDLVVRYGRITAVRGVTFSVAAGST